MSALNNNQTEQALLQNEWKEIQAAKANPARFGVIYNRHYEAIFRYYYQRTFDEELSADLTAQTFLKAMQNLHKYEFKGVPILAWLYRISSNNFMQHCRDKGKRRVVALEDNTINELQDEIEDKEGLEINLQTLQVAVQQLDPDEVELIQMRFFEKRPFKEIAEILELGEGAVKARLYRLLTRLRDIFIKYKKD